MLNKAEGGGLANAKCWPCLEQVNPTLTVDHYSFHCFFLSIHVPNFFDLKQIECEIKVKPEAS